MTLELFIAILLTNKGIIASQSIIRDLAIVYASQGITDTETVKFTLSTITQEVIDSWASIPDELTN